MTKFFLSNVFLLLLVNLLVKPFWILGVDRAVQNSVGHEQYGIYINLFTITMLFSMMLDFGINNYTSTTIAKHKHLMRKQFAMFFSLKLLFSLVYLLITAVFGWLYGIESSAFLWLMVLGINQVIAYFFTYFRANIVGLQLYQTDALLSIADRGLMILLAALLYLVFKSQITIPQFIIIQLVGYLGALLLAFFVLKNLIGKFSLKLNTTLIWFTIKKSAPYALLALLMTFYSRTDYLLIKKLLPDGDSQNGIYAAANRLLEASNMIAVLVSGMLLPTFAKLIKLKQSLEPMVKLGILLLIIPASTVAALAWYYNVELMQMLRVNNVVQTAAVFKIVMLNFWAMCIMYVFGTLLTANENLSTLNRLATVALVANVVLNIIVIPIAGIVGAAIISACTQWFIALSNMLFAYKRLALVLPWRFVASVCLIVVLSWFMIAIGKQHHINIYVATALVLAANVIMLVATRLLNWHQVKALLLSKQL